MHLLKAIQEPRSPTETFHYRRRKSRWQKLHPSRPTREIWNSVVCKCKNLEKPQRFNSDQSCHVWIKKAGNRKWVFDMLRFETDVHIVQNFYDKKHQKIHWKGTRTGTSCRIIWAERTIINKLVWSRRILQYWNKILYNNEERWGIVFRYL